MIGKKNIKEILNIGLSKGISVLELINLFEKSNNINVNYEFGDRRDGDIEEIYADCKLAQKKVPKMFFDYNNSGSWTERTYKDNIHDFQKIKFQNLPTKI